MMTGGSVRAMERDVPRPMALARLRLHGVTLLVAPVRAFLYLLASFAFIALCASLLEWWVIPWFEARGRLAAQWYEEDSRINKNNEEKNLGSWAASRSDVLPVWTSKGFPVSKEKTRKKRILVMGDSFVWGDGYPNMNDIWWRQLQRELERRGYEEVEVIAAGLNGMATRQELEAAEKVVPAYRPDIVIWGYVTNDPDEGIVKLLFLGHDRGVAKLKSLTARLFPRLMALLEARRNRKRARLLSGPIEGYEYDQWERQLYEGANLAAYEETVGRVSAFIRASGVPQFFITVPNSPRREGFEAKLKLAEALFASKGVRFVNILEDFVRAWGAYPIQDGGVLTWGINPANGHPGPTSTHYHAVSAANVLERDYPETLGPKGFTRGAVSPAINDWMPFDLNPERLATGEWKVRFPPADSQYVLSLPIGRPHVLLSLASPVALQRIDLSGPSLTAAQVFLTSEHPVKRFDDGRIRPLSRKKGAVLSWEIQPEMEGAPYLVNTIRLVADFSGHDRSVSVALVPRVRRPAQ